MGLLDSLDSDQFRLGMGLLAAGGARSDGAGMGQRLMEGLGSLDAFKAQQMKQKYLDMQMQEAQAKLSQEKANREALRKTFTPMQGGQAMTNGKGPTLENAANLGQMPKFDPSSFFANNPDADMSGFKSAAEAYQLMHPVDKLMNVPEGNVVLNERTRLPVYTATAKTDKPDAKIAQFEYAKANGYKGSFDQFVTLGPSIMAGAMAPLRNAQIGNILDENAYNLPPPRRSQGGGGVSVTAGGKTYTFPDQKSANNFKLKAGVQ